MRYYLAAQLSEAPAVVRFWQVRLSEWAFIER